MAALKRILRRSFSTFASAFAGLTPLSSSVFRLAALMAEVAKVTATQGPSPKRPPFWGGFRITPVEIEFWADGAFRLHDRFVWRRRNPADAWVVTRLNP